MIIKPTININGEDFQLATTLRVAFKIQGQNEHKPYARIFQELTELPVEKQIDMLYASFICANPEQTKVMTDKEFRDYCFDNMTIKDLMELLQQVIKGIMGVSDDTENSKVSDEEKN